MHIQVVKQNPPGLLKWDIEVPDRSTVASVLDQIGIEVKTGWSISVWGERRDSTAILEEGDRLEISAPLVADPKVARRMRQKRQEAKNKQ